MKVAVLNAMEDDAAREALERCCGAKRWVDAMVDGRPYMSDAALFETADAIWRGLWPPDYLEAFTHHPRIGDVAGLREKFASTAAWAEGEQAGAGAADEATLQALAEGNQAYETKFGHIFIVCATGKTASEMLALLQARLPNGAEEELAIAAEEQRKITRLRLEKLLA